MKAILMIDIPVLDDGRHLCNECPIWNKEKCFCEYDRNTDYNGCPLKSLPERKKVDFREYWYKQGWNACLDEICQ